MPTYPLPTLAVTVDETGISGPPFSDILASLQASFKLIYGDDIYIDPDSQDGQWLAVLALAFRDVNDAAIAVYNQFSPGTAIGAGLSSNVKLNGLRRQVASNSTVVLNLTGDVGTPLGPDADGSPLVVGDSLGLGTQWNITDTVEIPISGLVSVTAICSVQGNIAAAPGTLTDILTPRAGWQTATNPASATLGNPVELDAQLRRRQAKSTALPAQTPREAILGAVLEVAGVLRAEVYQNDTNTTTTDGLPPHNIAVVVSGGSAPDIAAAIALKKPPGTPTAGTTVNIVFDSKGMPDTIRFYPLTEINASYLIFLTPLTGYVDTTGVAIQQAVAQYTNALDIGEDAAYGNLWSPANLTGDDATFATGESQSLLDTLKATYKVTQVAQNRADTLTSGGPYGAGTSTVAITNVNETLAVGDVVYMILDDLSAFRTIITAVSPTSMSFAPAVPSSRSIPVASLIYVADDMTAAFNEAFVATTASVQLVVPQ